MKTYFHGAEEMKIPNRILESFKIEFEKALFVPSIEELRLPEQFDLCLIDRIGGSDTRKMVKNVLEWAKNHRKESGLYLTSFMI